MPFARGDLLKASAIVFLVSVCASFLTRSAVQMASESAKFDPFYFSDRLRLLPLLLVLNLISVAIATLGSAGLFSMVLQENRGATPDMAHFWIPCFAPLPFVPVIVAATLSSEALSLLLTVRLPPSAQTFGYILIELALAPFFLLVLPLMIERGYPFGVAFRRNVELAFTNYFRLMWVAIRGYVLSGWGVLLLGIGLIWTMPQYQREVVLGLREVEGLPLDGTGEHGLVNLVPEEPINE